MTDQRPDAGDNTPPTDNGATPPEADEIETASEPAEAAAPEASEPETGDDLEAAHKAEDEPDPEGEAPETEAAPDADTDADTEAPAIVAETEAEAADAAAAGAAWTTTPVAPDPDATEAALAALAAKPEVTLEPPETPPPPPPGDEEDEGTPVLLVGGILVGAFIVALAIVLILFRPFDSLTDPDASLSPSPVATEQPSESPSAIATVGTPDFVAMRLEDAEATATDYGLVVRVNPVETDEAEPGIVLDQ
ncbi:MAG: PASTA domain-containing protein, partial [Candidatus Limnocylindrales bacterium]